MATKTWKLTDDEVALAVAKAYYDNTWLSGKDIKLKRKRDSWLGDWHWELSVK